MLTSETTSAAALASRLRGAVTRLNRRLRASSLGPTSPGQASALAMIDRLGTPSVGELAAAEQVRPPSMTRIVDALQSMGLVTRTVDPLDRRCLRVALTGAGRRELAAIRRRKTEFLEARLAALGAGSRERVAAALDVLEQLAED